MKTRRTAPITSCRKPVPNFARAALGLLFGLLTLLPLPLIAAPANPTEPFTGEAAIEHLKAAGQYESLSAAITGTRYTAKPIEDRAGNPKLNAFRAQNPAHGMNSTFSPEGLTFTVPTGEGADVPAHTVGWRLRSLGYGAAQAPVPAGTLSTAGQRVELVRTTPAITEWFHNNSAGLEHGFTVRERPAANPRGERLSLVLAVTGSLVPQADATGQSLALCDTTGRTVLTYAKLKVWDATGAELPASMQVEDGQVSLDVIDTGATYPLTIDPTFATQQAYLKASNTGGNDRFAQSLAVSGDTVVIGAPAEDSNATGVNGNQSDNSATDSGAAYVFVRNGTTWTQQAYLKASNTGAADEFGRAVSISGNTIVVAAPFEDSNATGVNGDQSNNSSSNAGAVYVFVRSGTIWTQQAYLKASNTGSGDFFGYSVSVSGDTLVASGFLEDSNATGVNGNQADNSSQNAGCAYVFVRNGTTWTQQAYLKASNTGVLDQFGASVSVSGDTIVVGANIEDSNATGVNGNQTDNSATNSGAAYIFVRNGTTWTQQAYLKAGNTEANDIFGNTVSVSGDTIVIGAASEDSNATGVNGGQSDISATDSGAAYVFTRNGTTWTQQAYLKASNTGAGDNFGISVSVSGDTLAVGSSAEDSSAIGVNGDQSDNNASNSGAAYVFVRSGTAWTQQAYLKANNTGADDAFSGLAVSGDTVVVGARLEDSNATGVNGDGSNNSTLDSGAAYVFTVIPDCVAPPPGVVLWLPLDEFTGASTANLYLGGNNGALVNSPTHSSGYVSNGLCFDGTSRYVDVPDYPAINPGIGDLSFAAWVKRDPSSGNGVRVIFDKRDASTQIGYHLVVSFGNLLLQLTDASGQTNYRDTGVVPADDQWHFVAVTVNRASTSGGHFYVDATPTGTFNPTDRPGSLNNTNSFQLGRSPLSGNSPWLGCIDEAEVFNRVLSSAEIAAIFGSRSGQCKAPAVLSRLKTAAEFGILGAYVQGLEPTRVLLGNVGGLTGVSTNITVSEQLYTGAVPQITTARAALQQTQQELFAFPGTNLTNNLDGLVVTPGIYNITGDAVLSRVLNLQTSGYTSVFVFNVTGSLRLQDNAVVASSGVLPQNVIWNVAGNVTVGTGASMSGVILAGGNLEFGLFAHGLCSLLASGNVTAVNSLFILSPDRLQTFAPEQMWETIGDDVVSPAPPPEALLQAAGTGCARTSPAFVNKYGVRDQWEPDRHFNVDIPVKTILVNFQVFQDSTGGNEWANNDADIAAMQKILAWTNDTYQYNRQPTDPISAVCGDCCGQIPPGPPGGCWIPDTKIRWKLNRIEFYQSGTLNTSTAVGLLQAAVQARDPNMLNQVNVYWINAHGGGAAFASLPSFDLSQHSYVVMKGGRPPEISWYSRSTTLGHELGHVLELCHTYPGGGCASTAAGMQANEDWYDDIFGQTFPGNAPHPLPAGGNPKALPYDGITNNLMGGNQDSNYSSPKQIGKMHRALSLKSVRRYVEGSPYSATPLVISSNETWDFDFRWYSDIQIESGSTLTITCKVSLSEQARVIVKPGARLVLDGGTLTTDCPCLWQGVEVWGNKNLSQLPTANSPQGFFEMKNGATIENAQEGVRLWHLGDYYSTGGIIQASNSFFKNCRRAVEFMSYQNFDPGVPTCPLSNVSFFVNCQFETDGLLKCGFLPNAFVTMWDTNGVRFLGNTFINKTPALYAPGSQGRGIGSIDAGFFVGPNGASPGRFENLFTAVEANASLSPSRLVTVTGSELLNNYRGMVLRGYHWSQITSNDVTVPPFVNFYPLGIPFGLLLDGTTGFQVEANVFHAPMSSLRIGVKVINSGSGKNVIYRNTFTGLRFGTWADGSNDGPGYDDGLQIRCNDYSGGSNDIFVPRGRVGLFQGWCGDSKVSAGNTFSHPSNPNTYDIYNPATNPLLQPIIYYHGTPQPETPLAFTPGWVIPAPCNVLRSCPSTFGLSPAELTTIVTNKLNQASILINALDSNPFIVTPGVVPAGSAPRSEIAGLLSDREQAVNGGFRYKLADESINGLAEVITALEMERGRTILGTENALNAGIALVQLYRENRQYSDAHLMLNSLAGHPELAEFRSLQGILLGVAESNRSLRQMTPTELATVQAIAMSPGGMATALASGAAAFATGDAPPLLEVDPGNVLGEFVKPTIKLFNYSAGLFSLSLNTFEGVPYRLEYKNVLTDPSWTFSLQVVGTGNAMILQDNPGGQLMRFYRVRIP